MARPSGSYRGARRNLCLRELKTTWGPEFYYNGHHAKERRATILRKAPSRYHPMKAVHDAFSSRSNFVKGAARVASRLAGLLPRSGMRGA